MKKNRPLGSGQYRQQDQSGSLWNSLTHEQQKELLLSYEESLNAKNLFSHEHGKQALGRWLKR